MPFEVPDNWKWCKLEDIVSFGGGKTPSMDNKEYWHNGNHLWVTSKDMKYSHITDSLMKITDKALELMTIYERGTLLIVTRSGILRHTLPISILESPATVNQDLKAISPYLQELSEYLYIVIKANEHFILKEYHKDGTTVDSIDFDKFKCLPIPLPPITEQRRIVAETKHWFALIEQINQDKSDLHTIIHKVKNKMLDFAIHGKLVPQDPNDEPAFELLKRINPKAEITCDNGHSEKLPQNWCWTKGKFIFSPMKSVRPTGEMFQYIDIDSIDNTRQAVKEIKVIKTSNAPSRASRYTQKEDVIFSMVRPYLRNIAKISINDCIASTGFYVCRPLDMLHSEYCYYLMISDYVVCGLNQFMKGDNSPSINKGDIDNWLFPLPPFSEQQRIVAKIEELFSVLNNIQNALEA